VSLLRISNIDFSYGNRKVLDQVNLEVKTGEVICIVGENGAGKSTLIKCINGINRVASGPIEFQGRQIKEIPKKKLSRLIGYVPQSTPINFPATVFDVILLGRIPHIEWKVGKKDREIVSDIILELNIEHLAFRPFNQLSGGERQKVLIARALVQQPKLLLLDEPTSDLDLRHQLEVMETIRNAVKEGADMSAIIAIHDLNLASKFSDKIAVMHKGRIEVTGKSTEVITADIISRVYGIEAEVMCKDESGCVVVVPLKLIDTEAENRTDGREGEKIGAT
jgi:iron complex transport system ATP-binding protein